MTVVTTVQFRKNLKQTLDKAISGEKVILKYYDKEFILKPTVSGSTPSPKPKKKKLSPQAAQILADLDSPEHKEMAAKSRELYPELYTMTVQEEKEYIRNEKAKKYGL